MRNLTDEEIEELLKLAGPTAPNTEELTKFISFARIILPTILPPPIPPRFVYLAGPILGCTAGEANDWRKHVDSKLRPHNIIGISPLRCEPLVGERYSADYPDPRFGTPRAIAAKNKFDVRQCDMTLAVLPRPIPPKTQSYGTLEEIAWADEAGKMTIQVTDDPGIIRHPVVDSTRGWKLAAGDGLDYPTIEAALDAACEIIIGVLGGYAGGKNV